jgi:nucleoside-triphosphatase THEP1
MIFLLTGDSGSGKTTLLKELASQFTANGIITGGFTAPGSWLNGKRSGFTLHDLYNKLDYVLAETGKSGSEMYGRFVFNEETLKSGNHLLSTQAAQNDIDLIVVDEVGPYELSGKGWAPALNILAKSPRPQIWAVRPELIADVQSSWAFTPSAVFPVLHQKADDIFQKICKQCNFPLK